MRVVYKQDLSEDEELDEDGIPVRRLSSMKPRATAFVRYGANHRVFAVIKEQSGTEQLRAALPSSEALETAVISLTELQTVLKGNMDEAAVEAAGSRLDAVVSLLAPVAAPTTQESFANVVKSRLTGLMTEAAGHSLELGDKVGAIRDELLSLADSVQSQVQTETSKKDLPEDGEVNKAELVEIAKGAPSAKESGHKSPPKGYPKERSKYADPTNYKYPLDTAAHVRNALARLGDDANRTAGSYSTAEWSWMKSRAEAAAKKLGIKVSKEDEAQATEIFKSLYSLVSSDLSLGIEWCYQFYGSPVYVKALQLVQDQVSFDLSKKSWDELEQLAGPERDALRGQYEAQEETLKNRRNALLLEYVNYLMTQAKASGSTEAQTQKENPMDSTSQTPPATPPAPAPAAAAPVETVAAAVAAPVVAAPAPAPVATPAPAPEAAPAQAPEVAPSYVTKEDLTAMKTEILNAVKELIAPVLVTKSQEPQVVPPPAPIQVPSSTVPVSVDVAKAQAGRVSSIHVTDMTTHPALKDMDFNGLFTK